VFVHDTCHLLQYKPHKEGPEDENYLHINHSDKLVVEDLPTLEVTINEHIQVMTKSSNAAIFYKKDRE
jgi:hypothetical protein